RVPWPTCASRCKASRHDVEVGILDPASSLHALADARYSTANVFCQRHDGRMTERIELHIRYRDDWVGVTERPAGWMVHDSALARGETDFAADRLREQFGKPIFLIHRLDRATSGCLLLAFDRDTASTLGKAVMAGGIEKDYHAVCRGWPAEQQFTVDH